PESRYSALRRELYIDEIVFRRYALELAVPRMQLIMDDDHETLACEICLLSQDSKVLCGILESFKLPGARTLPLPPLNQPTAVKSEPKKPGFLSRVVSKLPGF